MTGTDLDALMEALSAPEGWMPSALRRLEQDALAARIPAGEQPALARAARAAGATMAADARRRGWASADHALRDLRVDVVEDDAEGRSGPLVHHAVYTAPPARVTLYRAPIAALERLLTTPPLRERLGHVPVREAILAHELFHHLVDAGGAPESVRPRVQTLRLGRWRRHAVVRAAEEIGAAGFAGAWCGLAWAPELLDHLTLALSAASDHRARTPLSRAGRPR